MNVMNTSQSRYFINIDVIAFQAVAARGIMVMVCTTLEKKLVPGYHAQKDFRCLDCQKSLIWDIKLNEVQVQFCRKIYEAFSFRFREYSC